MKILLPVSENSLQVAIAVTLVRHIYVPSGIRSREIGHARGQVLGMYKDNLSAI